MYRGVINKLAPASPTTALRKEREEPALSGIGTGRPVFGDANEIKVGPSALLFPQASTEIILNLVTNNLY